jgi:hypothetical protein
MTKHYIVAFTMGGAKGWATAHPEILKNSMFSTVAVHPEFSSLVTHPGPVAPPMAFTLKKTIYQH